MDLKIFSPLVPTQRARLRASETLFFAGERVRRIYCIEQGVIALVRPLRNGGQAILHTARAGEILAESSLFSEKYHCDAVARKESTIVSAAKPAILQHLRGSSASCLQFAEALSAQLRALRARHEVIRIRGAEERLLRWLLLHARGSPPKAHLSGTLSDLAEELSLTREALYRSVAKLRASRVVLSTANRCVTLNESALAGISAPKARSTRG